MKEISLKMKDGTCRAFEFRPKGKPPWPAVLVFMDGIGIRPAMLDVGERVATYGYFALLPDLFYRSGRYEPMNAKTVFSDQEQRKTLMEKFFALAPLPKILEDVPVFLDYLDRHPDVKHDGIATTGYCMGGRVSLASAGAFPNRIKLAASFHPGRMATDEPDSPHRFAPSIKARVYIAGAIEDPSFPDDQKERLDRALTEAGVDHTVETYPARHGWVLTDNTTYDAPAAERHWTTLTSLLETEMKK